MACRAMPRPRRFSLSIPRRLLLLTIIPIVGLVALASLSFRTLYLEHKALLSDAEAIAAYHREIDAFTAGTDQFTAERATSERVFAQRNEQTLAAYRATFAATDRAVADLYARLDALLASPQAKLFADKNQSIRSFIDAQLADARTATLEAKKKSGDVFYIYMKIAYSSLGISESMRPIMQTPQGFNLFDAIFAMQKIHIQESVAHNLALQGLQSGGLPREELALLRRQYFISTENEYYLLKFQPELRAYFKSTTRKTDDDTAFYSYLSDLSGVQPERTPFPEFKPKGRPLPEFIATHFAAYTEAYRYAFNFAAKTLADAEHERRRHALLIGAALLAGIAFSLAVNLAITRSTRRSLASVANNLDTDADEVKSASSQLTAAGDRMSADAARYAEAIDQIGTSLGHVATSADTNKGHAAKAAATTQGASNSVDAGLSTISQLDAAMTSARGSGQKINQVIARINDLSFQTNLLALNAAVEAARAGEAGAGFAVVADEVRRLAGRCAEAARETAELIGESTKDTGTAIAKSDDLAKRFKDVSRTIHEVHEIVAAMSTNFSQQAASIGDLNRSVADQRTIAQNMVNAAGEAAVTARSMEAQVDSLEASVARMDTLLGQARAQEPTAPSPVAPPPAARPSSVRRPPVREKVPAHRD